MSDTLYRIGDEMAMDPDDWLDQLVDAGALVPVEIDYEAAAGELPYALQMWQVKDAVNAALGIEGGDDGDDTR